MEEEWDGRQNKKNHCNHISVPVPLCHFSSCACVRVTRASFTREGGCCLALATWPQPQSPTVERDGHTHHPRAVAVSPPPMLGRMPMGRGSKRFSRSQRSSPRTPCWDWGTELRKKENDAASHQFDKLRRRNFRSLADVTASLGTWKRKVVVSVHRTVTPDTTRQVKRAAHPATITPSKTSGEYVTRRLRQPS